MTQDTVAQARAAGLLHPIGGQGASRVRKADVPAIEKDQIMDGDAFVFLVPVSLFVGIAAIIIAVVIQNGRYKQHLQETVRKSIDAGVPMSPETIRVLTARPRDDLRLGSILIAIWLACIMLGVMVGFADGGRGGHDFEAVGPLAGVGSFPGLIGVALVALHFSRKGDR